MRHPLFEDSGYFNPRSRVGNDPVLLLTPKMQYRISIHVPAWGTTLLPLRLRFDLPISIHVPAWGTTIAGLNMLSDSLYFNPRSRVGNDVLFLWSVLLWTVDFNPRSRVGNDSIDVVKAKNVDIFQSTFPRGERPCGLLSYTSCRNFNPRSRVGNDDTELVAAPDAIISIHVPAWGTTPWFLQKCHTSHFISIHVPAWGTTAIISKIFSYILGIITKNIT